MRGQAAAPARDDIVNALSKFESGPELDIPALKPKIIERSKIAREERTRALEAAADRAGAQGLPTFNVAIQFDVDTPIILPESYETVGRIADAFVNAPLLPYSFLIVGHTDTTAGARPM